MNRHVWLVLVLFIVAVAALLRLPRLSQRPMHTDEAVHAAKMGEDVLEAGRYVYDPYEYHGPTLNAFTLPIAWLRGQLTYRSLDEVTLRLVPALFGVGLVLLPLLFQDALGKRATVLAMFFTAVSPALVFYSRYYIMEIQLVFFTALWLGCLWRYARGPHWGWALGVGISMALMHATKETCIIAWACLGLSGTVLWCLERPFGLKSIRWRDVLLALGAGGLVSIVLFSWFFTNPRGIWDSWATYGVYLNRAGHGEAHFHPWFYYLDLLTWIEGVEWPGWNEDYLVVMALIGMGIVFYKRSLPGAHLLWVRLLALFTFLMTVFYSSLHYKTPWSILGALHGMILLAAVATDQLWHVASLRWERKLLGVFIVVFGVASPTVQSVLLNFKFDADQTNPYVYAHTHRDIFAVCNTLREYVEVGGEQTTVQAICPAGDYWPLPWYLRDLPRVGYLHQVDANTPVGDILVTQPVMEEAILRLVFENPPPGYRELFLPMAFPTLAYVPQLRHGVPLSVYVRKSLWDRVHLVDALETLP